MKSWYATGPLKYVQVSYADDFFGNWFSAGTRRRRHGALFQ